VQRYKEKQKNRKVRKRKNYELRIILYICSKILNYKCYEEIKLKSSMGKLFIVFLPIYLSTFDIKS